MTDTERLQSLDLQHLWHPFTQHDEWEADGPPLVIDRAEGCWLIDVDGRRYLDGVASLWTNVHGHRHPRIDAAVRAQLDRVAHSTMLGLSVSPAVELAARLVAATAAIGGDSPPLNRVFYSDSGSTAVEVALKMAFQCQQQRGETGRTRFAALAEAYHGDTIGSVSVGGIGLFHGIYRPLLFDAVRLPAPERAGGEEEEECLREALRLLEEHGATLAALVVEPLVQGAAGMRMHSAGFLRALIDAARSAGVLVIVDEVATGFGRTGTMFALEQVGRRPDLLCLAKGLTGGYLPLAATLATEAVFDAFRGKYQDYRTFFHGHTYTGNALACAAALASLSVFEDEQVTAGLPDKIAALSTALALLPHVAEVRQHGLMAGALLRHDRGSGARVGHRVCMAVRAHGAIVRPLGDLIVFMPPLAMSGEEIALLGEAVVAGIHDELGSVHAR